MGMLLPWKQAQTNGIEGNVTKIEHHQAAHITCIVNGKESYRA